MCYQGDTARQRMEKMCSAFNASLYPCPTYEAERQPLLSDVETRLTELRTVLDKSTIRQCKLLQQIYLHGNYWQGKY